MKRIGLLLIGLIGLCGRVGAQNEATPVAVSAINARIGYDYLENHCSFSPTPYYDDGVLKNSFEIRIDIVSSSPINYSLYTYKKTFRQDGKRNFMQGIRECRLVDRLITQADIDTNLDKIYEFSAITNTANDRWTSLYWDGQTDPNITNPNDTDAPKYAVNDCLYVAAHNAETGALIATGFAAYAPQTYEILSSPGVKYDIAKDENDKETLTAKIFVAFDDRPVKMTAVLMTENCGIGGLTYTVVNQGAEAIVADINRRSPGSVIAYKELTNPYIDPAP